MSVFECLYFSAFSSLFCRSRGAKTYIRFYRDNRGANGVNTGWLQTCNTLYASVLTTNWFTRNSLFSKFHYIEQNTVLLLFLGGRGDSIRREVGFDRTGEKKVGQNSFVERMKIYRNKKKIVRSRWQLWLFSSRINKFFFFFFLVTIRMISMRCAIFSRNNADLNGNMQIEFGSNVEFGKWDMLLI